MDSPAGTMFGVSSDYEDSLYDCEEVGDEGVDQLVDIIEEQADSQRGGRQGIWYSHQHAK